MNPGVQPEKANNWPKNKTKQGSQMAGKQMKWKDKDIKKNNTQQ